MVQHPSHFNSVPNYNLAVKLSLFLLFVRMAYFIKVSCCTPLDHGAVGLFSNCYACESPAHKLNFYSSGLVVFAGGQHRSGRVRTGAPFVGRTLF